MPRPILKEETEAQRLNDTPRPHSWRALKLGLLTFPRPLGVGVGGGKVRKVNASSIVRRL